MKRELKCALGFENLWFRRRLEGDIWEALKHLSTLKSHHVNYFKNLICKGHWHCLGAFVNQAVA